MFKKLLQQRDNKKDLITNTTNLKNILEEVTQELTKIPKKEKEEAYSEETRRLLQQRKNALLKQNVRAYDILDKRFRKSKREDKTKMIIDTLDKDLDIRDRWMGIRQLKQEYQPNPYARRTTDGKHITQKQIAQKAADYLSEEQWGIKRKTAILAQEQEKEEPPKKRTRKIDTAKNTEAQYNIDKITIEEIWTTINKYKRRKAPGPDEIPMELFKEMDDKCIELIGETLNEWWNEEDIPTETLKARVVLIYKKGNTGKYENYRPISLLNSIYKIYAGIIQKRLAKTLDKHLSKTQFGFRKDKSTGDAIHLVRRAAEHGHGTKNKLHLVLLDWEKAFDKVDRNKMFEALERMSVHPKIINVIKSLYKNTQFKVEIQGESSNWMKQDTGIRQGCPLSPYLFIIVMTAMFEDVKEDLILNLIKYRIPGANFDEVMYADDTICISEDTKTMNQFIQKIESIGAEYGLTSNKNKCELLTSEKDPNIHFADKTKITKKDEVKYLGCQLNQKGDASKEIGKRISNAYSTLQKLQIFWRRSNCPISYKIIALDAVVRSKLIYGTDSMQLNIPDLRRMEKFHLQAMRKILKWDTTFINRDNTNIKIFQEVNLRIDNTTKEINTIRKQQNKKPKKAKKITPFGDFYLKMKLKRIEKTINSNEEIHNMTFDDKLAARIPPARKQGRPKFKWAERALIEYWNEIRKDIPTMTNTEYNPNSENMKTLIKEHAST